MTSEHTPPDAAPDAIDVAWDAPPASNGTHPEPFPRLPSEPTEADLADWSRGAAALSRMPARLRLQLTEHLADERARALEEVAAAEQRIDRLRYDTEAMLASGIGARTGARVLAEMSMEPPPPMLLDRLDPTGHTVLFGTGGVGKGLMAAWWTLQLSKAQQRVLIIDYENHPDEWARRVYAMGGSHLLDQVLHVAPLTAQWGGRRGAIWEQADDLRQLVNDWGATYLVIDSIVPACSGTDPLKPEAVSQYAGALELIGRPALSLGHVTKADDLRYPFGSVFWHNLSRVTWSAKKSGERVLLTHRKHNNYERRAATLIEVTWLDGLPVNVDERPAGEELSQRISVVLREGPLNVRQICDRLDEDLDDEEAESTKPDSVRAALRRGQKERPPRFVRIGSDQWGNG